MTGGSPGRGGLGIADLGAARRRAALRARRIWRRSLVRHLYRDPGGGVGRSVLVAGTGRSGTTWLADLIDAAVPTRLLFEPFHSRLVEAFRSFPYFPYLRPGEANEPLRAFCERVFTGELRHPWVDQDVSHFRPRLRVVKEIRANLFLKWIRAQFPELPIVWIIRHPCAVVASRIRWEWATDGDIVPMLGQPTLVEDFLAPYGDLIERAARPEEKHAVIWALHHLVPLRQLGGSDVCCVSFERLVKAPRREMARILGHLGLEAIRYSDERVARPATTSLPSSAVVRGGDPVWQWKEDLSPEQADRVLRIVDGFGLSEPYTDALGPDDCD